MKLKTVLNIFKKKKESKGVNLEYLIIYEDSGQPIYSRCWGTVCGLLGKKDELLTAFLAAVSTMPGMFAESDTKVHSMGIGSLKLLFFYTKSENVICAAFKEGEINNEAMETINTLFNSISYLLDEKYQETPWDRLNDPKVQAFEKELLSKIIYPWFHVASPADGSSHEDDCPLCLPTITTSNKELPVWGRIKNSYSTKTQTLTEVETQYGTLKIGDPAPNFVAETDENETIILSDFQYRKNVVLFFYPKANTPGCIIEAQGFRDAYNELKDLDVEVLGISVDDKSDLKSFRNDQQLTFPLVSDLKKEITTNYGCLNDEWGMANRLTFLVDKQGKIRNIWNLTGKYAQTKLAQHALAIKQFLLELE
ncbi:MAG: peroxiredoxin [Candidatus Heimdallarchaeota archaeon]|nr:MAG: peroxiredoxin [Candidatus Heimdallarchaeota archaeon]